MKTYPIMLDVRGRLCVVVGAGPVGSRKARELARAGANVRLVAAAPPADDLDGVQLIARPYEKGDLAGAMLVFACTDDRAANARIAADARACGALVNAADQPADCDFYSAATIRDGDVVVAIGTGGRCPSLSRALKQQLAERLPERIGEFAAALERARRCVHERTADPRRRRQVHETLTGEAGYQAFCRAGAEGLIQMATAALEGS